MNNNPYNIVIKFTPDQKEFLAKYQEEKQKKEQQKGIMKELLMMNNKNHFLKRGIALKGHPLFFVPIFP